MIRRPPRSNPPYTLVPYTPLFRSVQASIRHRNFRGLGQQLSASVNYSSYSKSVELGFTEPYLFDHNISIGGSIYRRDLNSFNFINNDRQTTFEQTTTGFQAIGRAHV